MKSAFLFCILLFSAISFASTEEQAVTEATAGLLKSEKLATARSGKLAGLRLGKTSMTVIRSSHFGADFKATLNYESNSGSEKACTVETDVSYSQMEIVAPGGGGFQIRNTISVGDLEIVCGL